jgi:hypothetical protein
VGSQGEVYSLQVTGFSRRGIFSSGNWVLKERYILFRYLGSQGEVYSLQVTGFSRRGIFSSGNWVLNRYNFIYV